MSFLGNFFDKTVRRSSLKEAQERVAAVKRSLSEEEQTETHPIYSNIKTQGRVMIFDEKNFSFRMVHDGQEELHKAPDSPNPITYQGRKSLQMDEDSFNFKLHRE